MALYFVSSKMVALTAQRKNKFGKSLKDRYHTFPARSLILHTFPVLNFVPEHKK